MCGGLENFDFPDDKAFVTALHKEELVFILPGACFRFVWFLASFLLRSLTLSFPASLDGFMRFVTTVPLPVLMDACDRIEAFCSRHRKV
jgi:tyrosine aminotransferase